MSKVTITGLSNLSREIKDSLKVTLKEVAESVYDAAREVTPVRSGRARDSWTKSVSDKDFRVENRVPYIKRLEAGASRQAPKGIIGPTLTKVKGKL